MYVNIRSIEQANFGLNRTSCNVVMSPRILTTLVALFRNFHC